MAEVLGEVEVEELGEEGVVVELVGEDEVGMKLFEVGQGGASS